MQKSGKEKSNQNGSFVTNENVHPNVNREMLLDNYLQNKRSSSNAINRTSSNKERLDTAIQEKEGFILNL